MQAKTGTFSNLNLYERDFVAWADEQALLLEQKRWDELDLVNLVEEVRDLGRRERDALESQLIRLFMHLLKWQYQPSKRTNSWTISIKDARRQVAKLRRKYPVLKVHTESIFYECYLEAREVAADETGLPEQIFPLECPYSLEQVLDSDFFPTAIEETVAGKDEQEEERSLE
jgi:hypothetical protein